MPLFPVVNVSPVGESQTLVGTGLHNRYLREFAGCIPGRHQHGGAMASLERQGTNLVAKAYQAKT
jgi:hypothetical protein